MRLPQVRRLGLRSRVTIAFALGALLLTSLLAAATLATTRQVLLNQREDSAFEFFTRNARSVQTALPGVEPEGLDSIVSSLNTIEGARPLIHVGDDWRARNPTLFGEGNVPTDVKAQVIEDNTARKRVTLDGEPTLIFGTPLRALDDSDYYEAVSLQDVQDTLNTLTIILVTAIGATTALAALLGYWASRRALAPLGSVSQAAEAIAGGRLDTRLEAPADRDLARFASSFNEMAGALEERIDRDARFASEVSHELRSPLMTLTASVEVLENGKDQLPERAQQALELLSGDIDRFGHLVDDLLEISRFDVGTAALQIDEVDVCEFVRQASRLVAPDVPVITDPRVEGMVIEADKRRLAQVLANLLENASKYGEGAASITVSSTPGAVQMTIADRGPGVPPEERSVIFDRFSRGSAGGRRGGDSGVGLGLSLVAEHVNLHGGRVWVEDNPGGGARFVVELPMVHR